MKSRGLICCGEWLTYSSKIGCHNKSCPNGNYFNRCLGESYFRVKEWKYDTPKSVLESMGISPIEYEKRNMLMFGDKPYPNTNIYSEYISSDMLPPILCIECQKFGTYFCKVVDCPTKLNKG